MRFLFSIQPSAAHLHLFLPPARELVARGHDVIIATAPCMTDRVDPDELDIPTNCWAERYIPNTALLPHVDVVVTHGGYTTVMGVIAAGKPMVLISFSADQPANALRCTELGIGATIEPGYLTARAAHDATALVLHDDRYQDRVAIVAADLAAMPGPDVAADILEATIR